MLFRSNYFPEQASFDCMAAVGAYQLFQSDDDHAFDALSAWCQNKKEWLFGHFNYPSSQKDPIGFPQINFFIPEILIIIKGSVVVIQTKNIDPKTVFTQIENQHSLIDEVEVNLDIQSRITESEYLDTVIKLKQHIQRGDCYEINFCQEFFAENAPVNPCAVFKKLNSISPNPFAVFYRINKHYCICASPERFLQKKIGRAHV